MDLQTIWFVLIVVLIAGYAVLDGYDLGVGVLHLFARSEEERRIHLNAIGPVWDGNEVWLLTGGGALFAAFPIVYATVFSGFYLALMLLLLALILRAASLEFRSHAASGAFRRFCDWAFGLGSLVSAIVFGVAFGNILRGIPINKDGLYTGSFLELLNPFSILVGLLTVAAFVMHGAAYLAMKSEGSLSARTALLSFRAWSAFVALYAAASIASLVVSPFLFVGLASLPLFWVLLAVLLASVAWFPFSIRHGAPFRAFLGSSASIACAIGLSALSLFPRLVPSSTDLGYSLTVRNASSSQTTLAAMLVIAAIGMPLVILYTVVIHRVFRGRVVLDEDSY